MIVVTKNKEYQIPIESSCISDIFGFRIIDISGIELYDLCQDLFLTKPQKVKAIIPPSGDCYIVIFYPAGTIKLKIYLNDNDIKNNIKYDTFS